jgi:hypothetical protein
MIVGYLSLIQVQRPTVHGEIPHTLTPAIPQRRPEETSGVIERVTFRNDESSVCVLRVETRGQREWRSQSPCRSDDSSPDLLFALPKPL